MTFFCKTKSILFFITLLSPFLVCQGEPVIKKRTGIAQQGQVVSQENQLCDCGNCHDENNDDSDEDEQENAAHKALQERIHFQKKVANFEVDMLLPKGALNPYIKVANNKNYPEAIKKSFEIFMNASVQSIMIHTKASDPLVPKSVRRNLLDKVSSQLMNASQEATKLLYASTERPELRTHLLELAENVRFKEIYTKIFVQSPDLHTKVSILTNILDCGASSWKFFTLVKSDLYNTRDQTSRDHINNQPYFKFRFPTQFEVSQEAKKASASDIFHIGILPILSAQWSPVKHAENLFSLKQMVCCAAQFYNMAKLTKKVNFLRDTIADESLRELTLPLGSNALIRGGSALYSLGKLLLKKHRAKQTYPFSEANIAKIDEKNTIKKLEDVQKIATDQSSTQKAELTVLTGNGLNSEEMLKKLAESLEQQIKENS